MVATACLANKKKKVIRPLEESSQGRTPVIDTSFPIIDCQNFHAFFRWNEATA